MKSCLLVIDFINEIVHENGKAPSCYQYVKEYNVLQHANQAIKLAKDQSIPIVFVKVGFSANYDEVPKHSPVFSGAPAKDAFKLGEWGTEFHHDLNYHAADTVIIKPRVSAFYATSLEAFLRAQGIEVIIICGVSSNNAVQATARDAHDRDYQVVLLEDACGAKNRQIHENTFELLKDFCKVISSSDLHA